MSNKTDEKLESINILELRRTGKYDDIINLPYKKSIRHPHMATMDRAAQFAPFAALTGYEDAVKESARLTENFIEMDEDRKAILDFRLSLLQSEFMEGKCKNIKVTYFVADTKKAGGEYVNVCGEFVKVDDYLGNLVLAGEKVYKIPIKDILDIDSEVFNAIDI